MATIPAWIAWLYPVPGLALQLYGVLAGNQPVLLVGTAVAFVGWLAWGRTLRLNLGWGLLAAILLTGLFFWSSAQHVQAPPPVAQVTEPSPPPAPIPEPKPEPVAAMPEPAPAPEPEKLSFEEAHGRIKIGMTLDEVKALVGDDMTVIGQSSISMLTRFEGEDLSFTAHFKNGKLDKIARLQTKNPPPGPAPQEPATVAEEPNTKAEPEKVVIIAGQENAGQQLDAEEVVSTRVITGRAKPGKVVRVEEPEPKPRPLFGRARLPRTSAKISRGPNDVNIFNHSENTIQVGVRLGMRGIDLTIPPGGMQTIFLSNGSYSVYYIDGGDPKTLKEGGNINVDSPPVALRIDLARPPAQQQPAQPYYQPMQQPMQPMPPTQ